MVAPIRSGAILPMAAHQQGRNQSELCPGMVYTPMVYNRGMTEETREMRKNMNLLKTEGNGWDTGTALRFLAGGDARWITGQVLSVDAGLTAAIQMP